MPATCVPQYVPRANTGLSKHGDLVFPHFWSWNQNLARVCARGGGGYFAVSVRRAGPGIQCKSLGVAGGQSKGGSETASSVGLDQGQLCNNNISGSRGRAYGPWSCILGLTRQFYGGAPPGVQLLLCLHSGGHPSLHPRKATWRSAGDGGIRAHDVIRDQPIVVKRASPNTGMCTRICTQRYCYPFRPLHLSLSSTYEELVSLSQKKQKKLLSFSAIFAVFGGRYLYYFPPFWPFSEDGVFISPCPPSAAALASPAQGLQAHFVTSVDAPREAAHLKFAAFVQVKSAFARPLQPLPPSQPSSVPCNLHRALPLPLPSHCERTSTRLPFAFSLSELGFGSVHLCWCRVAFFLCTRWVCSGYDVAEIVSFFCVLSRWARTGLGLA